MNIYCIGNAAVKGDDVPSQLVPFLQQAFPESDIHSVDPTETFTPEKHSILIDSVVGIDHVCIYSDIDAFVTSKRISVHDFDLGLHLQLLKKIHKLPTIWIIGVPQFAVADSVISDVIGLINKTQKQASEVTRWR